jgi:ubiquinol-cytochrome c reductase cytochrome b subunit
LLLTLSYYAILRSIPHKAGGIAAMGGAILVLLVIPFINKSDIRNTTYRPIFKFCFWLFIADFILLIWVGQKPVTDSYILLGQICTLYYFAFFLVIIPLVGLIEFKLVHYSSEKNSKV